MTNVSETLYKAADIIAEHGWCQNQLYSSDGQACLKGALAAAAGCYENKGKGWSYIEPDPVGDASDHDRGKAFAAANRAVQKHLQDLGELSGIPHAYESDTHDWNDRPTTTAEDVILVLKTVAKKHEDQ